MAARNDLFGLKGTHLIFLNMRLDVKRCSLSMPNTWCHDNRNAVRFLARGIVANYLSQRRRVVQVRNFEVVD